MAVVDATRVGPAAPEVGWQAKLRLRFAAHQGRTCIVEREHRGPLVVQRPFYPEGDPVCHAYVVHPPGGIVGGDELVLRIDVTDAGHALITTPAAAKLYRSAGARARIDQHLTVSSSSILEWLPQETIAFEQSRTGIRTTVVLEEGARFVGWDILALGRPAAGEGFELGALDQRLEVRRAGDALINERLSIRGGGPELRAPWGLAGFDTSATLVAVHPDPVPAGLIDLVRESLASSPAYAAVSVVSEAIVVRILTDGARQSLDTLTGVWKVIRPSLLQRPAEIPRIWAT